MTSGLEREHSAGSMHYYGCAFDARHYYFPEEEREQVCQDLRDRLPPIFDVVLHSTHIHIEYDFMKEEKVIPTFLVNALGGMVMSAVKKEIQSAVVDVPIEVIRQAAAEKVMKEAVSKPFYASKKFWVSAIAIGIPVVNRIFGWDLSVETISTILAPLLVYVVGQGMADFGKNN